ncbi:alpha/beta hydrolase [Microbacterium oleivorans]|uniref:alpha/beta fold hydrolase n=1 Tax=Microbacterium oleivorans TaxID=273677 RepID=UPI0010A35761|nr:alpha/beta hydrolase [Microbacterium oleivorans]THE07477.1 alpha/beta hydrolase [Microbacterium oleivorans]
MSEKLSVAGGEIAFDVAGEGPLVVLAHGMGDSRRSYRFVMPALVAAGYRVANVDIRGCGESSSTWASYGRGDIAGDLLAVIRHLGGPAVIVGQSISGGAATVAAATAPQDVAGVIELAPFTRLQRFDARGLLRNSHHRKGMIRLAGMLLRGSVSAWLSYLDLAIPRKPVDWEEERANISRDLSDPARMAALRAMGRTTPADAGAQLPHVSVPVLIVMGSADPDWADPRAEGEGVLGELPTGIGELAVIDGAGHYPHVERPDEVVDLAFPFLRTVFAAHAGSTDA